MSDDSHPPKRQRPFRLETGTQRLQRDVDEEMEFHLAMRAQKLIRLGLTPEQAREEALKQFGDVTTVRTECLSIDRQHHRAMNRANRLQDLRQDISYGIRSLRHNKGFAFVTVLILALGIGANTAMFSLIDTLILRALPVPQANQLVTIGDPGRVGSRSQGAARSDFFSYPVFQDLRAQSRTLNGMYASGVTGRLDVLVRNDSVKAAEPDHPFGRFVSGSYFSVLQVRAALGRTFAKDEDQTPGDAPVIVIGHRYWTNKFAADPSAIGRQVTINGAPFTIIGVAPETFTGDLVDRVVDVFIPLTMQPLVNPNTTFLTNRNTNWLQVMGRRSASSSLPQVKAEVVGIIERSLREHATAQELPGVEEALKEAPVSVASGAQGYSLYRNQYKTSLYTLMAATGLVLLVVCANVANLLLARATARSREMSVRMALGANRLRLVQQLLTESLLIAFAGGAVGLLVATWGSKGLLRLANGQGNGIMLDTGIDARLLAFSGAVSLLTAALFGLMPALRSTRVELATALRSSGRNVAGTGGRFSAGRMLVVAQVAMSVLLLVGTGMLLRSMQQLGKADVGADREHLIVADIEARRAGYEGARTQLLMRDLVARVRAVPGVVDAATSENGIFSGTESGTNLTVEGFVVRASSDSNAAYDNVGPSYFQTVGARMLQGRAFEERDNESGARVLVINETMAKHYFPTGNALGRRVNIDSASYEIVGVVADINGRGLRVEPTRRFYLPVAQDSNPPSDFYLQVRTSGDPAKVVAAVRQAIRGADAALPVTRVSTLSSLIEDSIRQDRLVAQVVTMFGVLTLVLSALGLYGVMAYATLRRTSEFGLRLALGAVPASIVRMVVREALALTAAGLLVGMPLAYAMSRVLREQFFGIGTVDIPSMSLAVIVLGIAATVAGYVPAMRAARVAPLDALRAD